MYEQCMVIQAEQKGMIEPLRIHRKCNQLVLCSSCTQLCSNLPLDFKTSRPCKQFTLNISNFYSSIERIPGLRTIYHSKLKTSYHRFKERIVFVRYMYLCHGDDVMMNIASRHDIVCMGLESFPP